MKVLIIRFSSIGDIVLTSPVVRCLHLQKNAEIHYLTKKSYASILASNPHIHQVHTLPEKELSMRAWIRDQKFDLIIDLHHNLRTYLLTTFTGSSVVRFSKLNLKKWLLVNLKIQSLPPIHIVDRYLQTCRKLGVVNDGKGLDFYHGLDKNEVISKFSLPERYLVYAIGGQHQTKQMPYHKIRELAMLLQFPLILLGGKEDHQTGERIAEGLDGVINLCGSCSLSESAAIIEHTLAIYTHDTGLMHIASAFKKDIFSIWGNTVPEFGMYPYMPGPNSRMFEVRALGCRPCSKIGHTECPKSHFNCMQKQDIPQLALQSTLFR